MKITIAPTELVGDPESNAMMQAFYSRSKRGIESRLEETTLDTKKIKNALNQYYVGYGHDSIGQCGFTTIFIEDVSMPAIKAIQDNDLFNGQESSTRYIDYASEPRVQVHESVNAQYQDIMRSWIELYGEIRLAVKSALIAKYSEDMLGQCPEDAAGRSAWRKEAEKFDKACAVKAFDIAGAFLPAGVLSNTSWTTSLATLNRELVRLVNHPLGEVREIAKEINRQVKERYPSVWKPLDMSSIESQHYSSSAFAYEVRSLQATHPCVVGVAHHLADLTVFLGQYPRPKYTRLPRSLHQGALMTCTVTMDYRSFRDVQRHRPLHPTIPLLGLTHPVSSILLPIHEWYYNCLLELGLWDKYESRIKDLFNAAYGAPGTPATKQYLYPMGMLVTFTMSGYLGDWIYFCELRSGETVHPTVRQVAVRTWDCLKQGLAAPSFLDILNVNVKPLDEDLMRPSFKRAAQDITKKD